MISSVQHPGIDSEYSWRLPYYLNGVIIDSVDSQKDLGILFDNQLKFHHHTTTIVTKANRLLGLIKRSFDHLDSDMSS